MLRKTIVAVASLFALAALTAAPAMALEKVNLTSGGKALDGSFTMQSTGVTFNSGAIKIECGGNESSVGVAENPGAKISLNQVVFGKECTTNGLGYTVKAYLKSSQAPLTLSVVNSTEGLGETKLALGIDYYYKGGLVAACEYTNTLSSSFKFGSQLGFSLPTFTRVSGSSGLCAEGIGSTGSTFFESNGKAVVAGTTLVKGLYRNTKAGPVAVKVGEGIQATSNYILFKTHWENGYETRVHCNEASLVGKAYSPAGSPALIQITSTSFRESEYELCPTESLFGMTAAVSVSGNSENGALGLSFADSVGGSATGEFGPPRITVVYSAFGGVVATCTYGGVWSIGTAYAFEEDLGLALGGAAVPLETASGAKICGTQIEPVGEFTVTTTGASEDPVQVMAG